MFTASREAVQPRCEHKIQAKKTMITVFFTPTRLVVLDALPHGQTFTQEYFMTDVLPCYKKKIFDFVANRQVALLSFTWTIPGAITARR
jgi:hypothetical protein